MDYTYLGEKHPDNKPDAFLLVKIITTGSAGGYALTPLGSIIRRAYRLIELSFACLRCSTAIEIAVGYLSYRYADS